MDRKLVRSSEDRVIAGVCSGIAEYFAFDPTLVRLGWALVTLFGGSGIVPYLVAWAIIPDAQGERDRLPVTLLVLFVGLPLACGLVAVCWAIAMAAVGAAAQW